MRLFGVEDLPAGMNGPFLFFSDYPQPKPTGPPQTKSKQNKHYRDPPVVGNHWKQKQDASKHLAKGMTPDACPAAISISWQ